MKLIHTPMEKQERIARKFWKESTEEKLAL